jgi:hypothetical protein
VQETEKGLQKRLRHADANAATLCGLAPAPVCKDNAPARGLVTTWCETNKESATFCSTSHTGDLRKKTCGLCPPSAYSRASAAAPRATKEVQEIPVVFATTVVPAAVIVALTQNKILGSQTTVRFMRQAFRNNHASRTEAVH